MKVPPLFSLNCKLCENLFMIKKKVGLELEIAEINQHLIALHFGMK